MKLARLALSTRVRGGRPFNRKAAHRFATLGRVGRQGGKGMAQAERPNAMPPITMPARIMLAAYCAANSLSASMTARFWSSVPMVMRRAWGRP